MGKEIPNIVKNQPYNLLPVSSQASHTAIHQSVGFYRVWYGTPSWAKALWLSVTGRAVDDAFADSTE